jgi:hypothetical protein
MNDITHDHAGAGPGPRGPSAPAATPLHRGRSPWDRPRPVLVIEEEHLVPAPGPSHASDIPHPARVNLAARSGTAYPEIRLPLREHFRHADSNVVSVAHRHDRDLCLRTNVRTEAQR